MASKPKKGLGTGLDVLFRDEYVDEQPTSVKISRIEPREDQPREAFDEDALNSLAESIQQYGILQPITVRKITDGYYQIIAGERRWRAAKLANLDQVTVNIIEADDKTASEIALVENLQRENLNPMEEAKGYKTLMDVYHLTQEQVAKSVGKSRPAITNSMRLLVLSEKVRNLIEEGKLSSGHARTLIPLQDEELQNNTANIIIEKGLSVRQTELLVKKLLKAEKNPETEISTEIKIDYSKEVSESLTKILGRRVSLNEGKKSKGKIIIEYYNADDRENLIDLLSKIQG